MLFNTLFFCIRKLIKNFNCENRRNKNANWMYGVTISRIELGINGYRRIVTGI